jgi:DNA-binding CsgD family transcriptional regulator
MKQLSHKDREALSAAVRVIHVQQDLPSLRQAIVEQLLELIPCDSASYHETDFIARKRWCVLFPSGSGASKRKEFREHFTHEHPPADRLEGRDDWNAEVTADFAKGQFQGGVNRATMFRQTGLRHQCALLVRQPGRIEMVVGLHRSRRSFAARELALLNILRPHVEQAYSNVKALEAARVEAKLRNVALEALPELPVVLDASGAVQWLHGRAERLLAKFFDFPAPPAPRLPDSLSGWLARERRRWAEPSFQTPPAPFEIVRGDDRLTARFTVDADGCMVLFLREERGPRERFPGFKLTMREAEVLHWLAEGKTNPEIAVILGTSRRTIDKHLQRVFAKLEVESRLAAIRKVVQIERGTCPTPP